MESELPVEGNSMPSDHPFRIVSHELYYFGYDDNAKDKTRLIVKEPDLQHVREYDVEEDAINYFCIGCFKKSQAKKTAYFHENRFLLAPKHHECDPIPLLESDFDQEMKKTMFLQAQSEQLQACSSMSLYTSAAVGNYTSAAVGKTGFAKTKNTPKIILPMSSVRPSPHPPAEVISEGKKIMNKFSAALFDMSTSSSPEYVPESSPSNSTPSTPIQNLPHNPLASNSVTSTLTSTPALQEQPGLRDSTSATVKQSTSSADVEVYNTAETPSELSHAHKSDKERRCAETPDSVHGHYLYNAFSGNQQPVKTERSEMDNASSSNLNETLTVDVSFNTPPSTEDNIAIPKGGYEYGYSWRTGSANKRIIVFEPNDRTKVRQYAGNGSYFWFCIDCFRIKKKKYKAFFEGETFMAAKTHYCDPILYEVAMHQQQEIIEKFRLNKPKQTAASTSESAIQSITEIGQESDNDNEAVGPSRVSKRIRYPKERSPEMPAAVPEENSIPDYSYLNGLEKRQVQPCDYQYGVGFKNQANGRIIVFEKDDRNMVREYSRDHKTTWYCRYCLRANKKLYAFMKETNIFCVPPLHSIYCTPKKYIDVMKEQQEIRRRYAIADANLLSPGITLSNIAPVKPGFSGTSPQAPLSVSRSPRQRSVNSQASSTSTRPPPPVNVLPIASVEVPVTPVSESEVRYRQRSAGRNSTMSTTPKHPVPQSSRSTFVPVFCNTSEPTSHASNSSKYRDVDETEYYYGFNEHGDLRKRLIVYEEDRRYVREYNSTETDRWKCINCKYGIARKDDDKFVITLKHECAPIPVKKSKELQEEYKIIAENRGDDSGRLSVSSLNGAQAVDTSQVANSYFSLRDKRPTSSSTPSITSSLREVNSADWEYGFDSAGEKEKRIIVFEPNTNHTYCREYRNDGADTRCLGCAKERRLHARWNDNKLFVPFPDAHVCEPRMYAEIQKRQDKIEARHGRKRARSHDRTLRNKRPKFAAEDTDTSNSPVAGEYESYNDMDTSEAEKSVVVEKPRVQSTIPVVTVVKNYKPSDLSTTVNYYNPSAFTIAECCKKLNIKYTFAAYQFWSNIDFEQISPLSRPSQTTSTTDPMYHGFSCLSLYLTGNESNTILIREMINRYVYNNFKSLGQCLGHDFSQFTHDTPAIRDTLWSFSLTDVHLECLSRWFDCRIGIYENGKWKRFGDWDIEDCEALTFLLQSKDGKYHPILSLSV